MNTNYLRLKSGNAAVEGAIRALYSSGRKEDQENVFNVIAEEMKKEMEIILPVMMPQSAYEEVDKETLLCGEIYHSDMEIRRLGGDDGLSWLPVFTGMDEYKLGAPSLNIVYPLELVIKMSLADESCAGVVINPWGDSISLNRELCYGLIEALTMTPPDVQDLNDGAEAYKNGDFESAVMYYTRSAKAGNVTALSNLGYCHYYGRSIPVDKEKAKECWERAAILGDIAAIYKLGDMYRNGDLKEDLDYSHLLYRRAFELSINCNDIYVYPDAYLRMLKHYPKEAFTTDKSNIQIAKDCVNGIKLRIEDGDNSSLDVLKEAENILWDILEGEEG